jgi:hypothetical protein
MLIIRREENGGENMLKKIMSKKFPNLENNI